MSLRADATTNTPLDFHQHLKSINSGEASRVDQLHSLVHMPRLSVIDDRQREKLDSTTAHRRQLLSFNSFKGTFTLSISMPGHFILVLHSGKMSLITIYSSTVLKYNLKDTCTWYIHARSQQSIVYKIVKL